LEGVAMKTVLRLWTIFAAIAPASVVNAQTSQNCNQIITQINNVGATVNQSATSYWAHRANFVDLIYGPSSQVVPDAVQVAEQEKSQADADKQAMPAMVASLKNLLAQAQNGNAQGQNNNGQGQNNNGQGQNNNGQGCLTPAQRSASVEPSIKQGKRVNFDQFPPETELEELTSGSPRMPLH
jgi:hypothetical protein